VGSIISMVIAIAAMFLIIQGIASSKLYLLKSNDKPTAKLSKKDPNYTESELPTHMPPGSSASSTTQVDQAIDEKDSKVEIEPKSCKESGHSAKSDSFSTLQPSNDSRSDILTAVMACTRMKSDSVSTVHTNDMKHDPDVISIIDCTRRKSDSISTVQGLIHAKAESDGNLVHVEKLSGVDSIEEMNESTNEPTKEHVNHARRRTADEIIEQMVEELAKEPTRSKSDSVSTDAETIIRE